MKNFILLIFGILLIPLSASASPLTATHTLIAGDNWIATQGTPVISITSQSLIDADSNIDEVCFWDSSAGDFSCHTRTAGSSFGLQSGVGYLIKTNTNTTITYNYNQLTQSIPLNLTAGDNYVGFPFSPTNLTSHDVLNQIPEATKVYRLENKVFEISTRPPGTSNIIGPDFPIESGRGYNIVLSADVGTWTPPSVPLFNLNMSIILGQGVINPPTQVVQGNSKVLLASSTTGFELGGIIDNGTFINLQGQNLQSYSISNVQEDHDISVIFLEQSQDFISPSPTLSDGLSEIVIFPGASEISTITIPNDVTNPTINFKTLLSGVNATIPSSLNFDSQTAIGTIKTQSPQNTVISGPSNWDGVMQAPTYKDTTSAAIPTSSDKTPKVSAVLEIGLSNDQLTFDKGIRVLLPGQAGKLVGYVDGGSVVPITTTCSNDSQSTGDALPTGGDCKIDVGSDLVIWTKHFTEFVVYSEEPKPTPSGGTPDHGGVPAPRDPSVEINDGAENTTSTSVTLSLDTLDITGTLWMMISNTEDFSDPDINWEAFATSKSWLLLDPTPGDKTVYVKMKNFYGGISEIASDSITLSGASAAEETVPTAETEEDSTTAPVGAVGAPAPRDEFEFIYNVGTLARGDYPDYVSELQKKLTEEGFYSASITGYFGPITFEAVQEYQGTNGIPRTGYVGPVTRAFLNGETVSKEVLVAIRNLINARTNELTIGVGAVIEEPIEFTTTTTISTSTGKQTKFLQRAVELPAQLITSIFQVIKKAFAF